MEVWHVVTGIFQEARGRRVLQMCEENTPPDKNTGWNISFENTKSVAGLQFLLLGHMAKAQVKGVFFIHTGITELFNDSP